MVFERVKINPKMNYAAKIEVINKNASIDPVFRLTESEFPGVEDLTSSDINENKFILEITNEQFEFKDDDEQCNHDYKGNILISRNNFGHLREKNFLIKGAGAFKFENNFIDTINGQAFDFENLENVHFIGNHFGFVLKAPVVFMYYKEKNSKCSSDELDLPENRIGTTIIKHNKFSRLNQRFFDLDADPGYKDDFVKDKFEITENEVSKRCNCSGATIDEDAGRNDKNNARIVKMLQDSSKCFSDQSPPLIGINSPNIIDSISI